MSTPEQLEENLAIFDKYDKLSETESAALEEARLAFLNKFSVPCTGCRYCSGCPRELDIPAILAAYSDIVITDSDFNKRGTVKELLAKGDNCDPRECVNCGTCVAHCPQNINTPEIMDKFSKIIASVPKEFR